MEVTFAVAIALIALFAFLLVRRADTMRDSALSEIVRLRDILQLLLETTRKSSDAEITARASLKKLAKIRKKKIRALEREMEELEALAAQDGDEEEEEEDDDEEEEESVPAVVAHKKKGDTKLAGLLIAMQNRMRKASDIIEAIDKRIKRGQPVDMDMSEIIVLLDTNLSSLESEIGS